MALQAGNLTIVYFAFLYGHLLQPLHPAQIPSRSHFLFRIILLVRLTLLHSSMFSFAFFTICENGHSKLNLPNCNVYLLLFTRPIHLRAQHLLSFPRPKLTTEHPWGILAMDIQFFEIPCNLFKCLEYLPISTIVSCEVYFLFIECVDFCDGNIETAFKIKVTLSVKVGSQTQHLAKIHEERGVHFRTSLKLFNCRYCGSR